MQLFVDHLDNDMPVEAFAQNLSTISNFATLPVPREKLPAWRARAVGESKAARYIAATVDAIAANGGVVPRGLGGYSGIEFEGRALSVEVELDLSGELDLGVYDVEVKAGDVIALDPAEADPSSYPVGARWYGTNGGLVIERAMTVIK